MLHLALSIIHIIINHSYNIIQFIITTSYYCYYFAIQIIIIILLDSMIIELNYKFIKTNITSVRVHEWILKE